MTRSWEVNAPRAARGGHAYGCQGPVTAVPGDLIDGEVPALPSPALPSPALPSPALPSPALPGSALPGSALPGSALPGSALPGSALPGSALPGSALPGSALPGSALPVADPQHFRLADQLAPMVEVWERLLDQHRPDRSGRCRTCTQGGTGLPGAPWPCALHGIAALAQRRHGRACVA